MILVIRLYYYSTKKDFLNNFISGNLFVYISGVSRLLTGKEFLTTQKVVDHIDKFKSICRIG